MVRKIFKSSRWLLAFSFQRLAHPLFPTPYSPLPIPHSPLPTPYSPLPAPHSLFPTPHSPLPTPHSLWCHRCRRLSV
ncbi:MAG: hypothetical protein KME42_05120 [Tildeniella nuda ZEHNDER 1965/U140]|nr:hypothetical protein [Tildeniella nuda ZEHNDER 1965/U140]